MHHGAVGPSFRRVKAVSIDCQGMLRLPNRGDFQWAKLTTHGKATTAARANCANEFQQLCKPFCTQRPKSSENAYHLAAWRAKVAAKTVFFAVGLVAMEPDEWPMPLRPLRMKNASRLRKNTGLQHEHKEGERHLGKPCHRQWDLHWAALRESTKKASVEGQ